MSGIIAQNSGRHTGLVKASGGGGGEWTLIQTQTASASSTISFTSGLDSTYDEYCFKFINIHADVSNKLFQFNGSSDSGSNYNVTKTTSYFRAYHSETDYSGLGYDSGGDLAQGTGFQVLNGDGLGIDNDQSTSGYLYLYNPADTTFVKHFMSVFNNMTPDDYLQNTFVAGYFNTTSAVDAIQFKMSSDNIDSGTISLYGIG